MVLLLKRVDDARRAGEEILAIIETGTDRPGDKEPGRPSELVLGLSAGLPSLSNSFGHAHAAAGLLHVAVGALCLRERMRLTAGADGLLQPAEPWLANAPRTVRVQVDALGGQSSTVSLRAADAKKPSFDTEAPRVETEKPSFLKKLGVWPGSLHVFSGADAGALLQALERNEESNTGPARLVLVVQGDATFESQRTIAREALVRVVAGNRYTSPSPLAINN